MVVVVCRRGPASVPSALGGEGDDRRRLERNVARSRSCTVTFGGSNAHRPPWPPSARRPSRARAQALRPRRAPWLRSGSWVMSIVDPFCSPRTVPAMVGRMGTGELPLRCRVGRKLAFSPGLNPHLDARRIAVGVVGSWHRVPESRYMPRLLGYRRRGRSQPSCRSSTTPDS